MKPQPHTMPKAVEDCHERCRFIFILILAFTLNPQAYANPLSDWINTAQPLIASQPATGACGQSDPDRAPAMVVIRLGRFDMGSPENEPNLQQDESPQHTVTIPQPFALSRCEITVGQFRRFIQETGYQTTAETQEGCYNWLQNGYQKALKWDNPGFPQTDAQPVVCVSWDDAQHYVQWLAQRTGAPYRLPTEAEWEYAARAGTKTAYWWGNDRGKNQANCDGCGSPWDNKQTAPAGSFKANAFGLYDTSGNVYEWTQDCWHDNYAKAPDNGSAWLETDAGDCGRRVIRGGSWGGDPQYLRSAYRIRVISNAANFNLGFRIARAL